MNTDKAIAEARDRLRRKAQNEETVIALNNLLTLEQQAVKALRAKLDAATAAIAEATARAERAEAELQKARKQERMIASGAKLLASDTADSATPTD